MGPFNPSRVVYFIEDFMVGSGIGQFAANNSGGTAALTAGALPSLQRHGVLLVTTGTGTTGRGACNSAELRLGATAVLFECYVNVLQLSTVGDEFIFEIGLIDQNASTAATEGIWFRYDRLTSTEWLRCTASAAAATTATATGSAVGANTWVRLGFSLNAAGTSCTFFVNGTSVGANTTNMPNAGANVRPQIRIVKSAGTTNVLTYVDYVTYRAKLATPR